MSTLVAKPPPSLPWWVAGLGLWFFGMFVMAHLVAGIPPFLDFIPLVWALLTGHLLFGTVTAAVMHWREDEIG